MIAQTTVVKDDEPARGSEIHNGDGESANQNESLVSETMTVGVLGVGQAAGLFEMCVLQVRSWCDSIPTFQSSAHQAATGL